MHAPYEIYRDPADLPIIVAENQAVLAAARSGTEAAKRPIAFTLPLQMSEGTGEGHGPNSPSPGAQDPADNPPEHPHRYPR